MKPFFQTLPWQRAPFFVSFFLLLVLSGCTSLGHHKEKENSTDANAAAEPSTPQASTPNGILAAEDDEEEFFFLPNKNAAQALTPEELEGLEELDPTLPDTLTGEQIVDDTSLDTNSTHVLLCGESSYYKSWKMQFDSDWLAKHRKQYKNHKKLNLALSHARTDAFIKLVYPSIEKIGYDFPVEINARVLSWIDYFTGKGRKNFVVWLKRLQSLAPELEKILEKNGLPRDLIYLAMIESGFSNKALSYTGAVGVWQFMPATARIYKLKINDWIDERRNPEKATLAAVRYLSDSYARYGSWHLAAASYNCGGCMNRPLLRHGKNSSFFDLLTRSKVNKQTAEYVPKIIAAMIISKNPDKFGFDSLNDSTTDMPTAVLPVNRSISIGDLANSIRVDRSVLEHLNPELRVGIVPPPSVMDDGKFNVVIPASKLEVASQSINSLPDAPTSHLVAARIKRKEQMTAFAGRYQISLASLMNANSGLKKNSVLHAGQTVYIPVSLGTGQFDKFTAVKYKSKRKGVAYKHKKRKRVHKHHYKKRGRQHAQSS